MASITKSNSGRTTWAVLAWALVLAWMALIFFGSSNSSLPSAPDALIDVIIKKLAHVTEYAILAMLAYNAFSRSLGANPGIKAVLFAGLLAFLYAVSDELHQAFTPGRHPSAVDVGIDSIGIITGLSLTRLKNSRRVAGKRF